MVRSPRLRRPALYSGQLRIRYDGFAYLYWLRLGYLIGGDSGSELHQHDAPKPEAMHQRHRDLQPDECGLAVTPVRINVSA